MSDPKTPVSPAPPVAFGTEDLARRKRRSVALGLLLAGLVVFFYVITLVKTGPSILSRVW
jgi:hypothetical protein